MENKGRVVCQSHKKKAVAFCFNETCQKNKIICVTCLIRSPENHSGHQQMVQELDENQNFDFNNYFSELTKQYLIDPNKLRPYFDEVITKFQENIDQIDKETVIKGQYYNQQFLNPSLENLINNINQQTNSGFLQYINNQLSYEQFNNKFQTNLQKINKYINSIEKLSNLDINTEQFTNFSQEISIQLQSFQHELYKFFKLKAIEQDQLTQIISSKFPQEFQTEKIKINKYIDWTGQISEVIVCDKNDFKMLVEINNLIQAQDLVNVIFSLNLKQKQLDDNSVSEMSKLLKMLNSVQSIKICLENNKLNELGFISIFCALKTFNKLIHLQIYLDSNGGIGQEAMTILTSVLITNENTLKELFLSFQKLNNNMNSSKLSLGKIIPQIKNLSCLISLYLDLNNNQLDDEDSILIQQMLKDKNDLNILKIFLDYNKLSSEGAKRIVKQLGNMRNLKQIEMHIRNNKIAEKTKKEIKNDFKLKIQAAYKEILV